MCRARYSLYFLLFLTVNINADCKLSLKTDFLARPSPVYMQNGAYLAPNSSSGEIVIGRSETILIACPGDKRRIVLANQTTSYDVLEAHCILDDTFRVDRWIGKFKDIKCNTQPWFTSQEISGGCVGRNKLYRIGYTIKNKLYKLYDACFDSDILETLYVEHVLTPSSKFIQTSGASRPQFSEGGLFGKVSMAELYKIKKQEERINKVLGSKSNQYLSKTEYLTRGHLAPRADFVFQAEQRATFHYVNTAPQWRKANAGAWAALEDGLRRRVNDLGRPLTVYTGSFGVSSLDGHPFYMTVDKNNNDVVPVPMYFYKLAYDPISKAAVAFVTINNSALNATDSSLHVCDSVCEGYSWLKWRGDTNTCCHYEDLADHVRLPVLQVSGLLPI